MSNIGQAVTTVVGATVGFFAGGPVGAMQGASFGYSIGSVLFPTKLPSVQGPRLDDLSVTLSNYGTPIPLIYGRYRVAGNIFWSSGLSEISTSSTQGGKGGGGQRVTEFAYYTNLAVAISGRSGGTVKRVWANKKVIFDADNPENPTPTTIATGVTQYVFPDRYTMRVYDGTHSTKEPRMEAVEGSINTPAYKHLFWIALVGDNYYGFDLADYGNSVPNIEVELEADDQISVGDVIADISDRAGVEVVGDIWIDDVLTGYAVGSQTSAVDALIPLALAYDFDMVEASHRIRVVRRPRALSASVPNDDLGAHPVTGDYPELMPLVRAVEKSLPRKVNVTYPDPAFDYQNVTQSVTRQQTQSDITRDIQLPVAITGDLARQVATRVLWGETGERLSATISLSMKWGGLQAGQTIAIKVDDFYMPFRVINIMRGQDGVIMAEVVYDDFAAYSNALAGAEPRPTQNELTVSQVATWMVIDAPFLRAGSTQTGFYWAMTSGARWRGATFLRSIDGGATYSLVGSTSTKAGIGDIPLALGTGSPSVWDEVNTIVVTLRGTDTQLISVTELEVFNGANAAWIGNASGEATGEIIQYRDATLLSPGVYELSGLLRGRLGTEHTIGLHGVDEVFVSLERGIFDADFGLPDWNLERDYKAESRLADNSGVVETQFTNTGERAMPRSPVHVKGTRDTSNNLTIEWTGRTRTPVTGLAELVPMGESVEAYDIDIIVGGSPVRTISATTTNAPYTAAEQTADGITPGNPVTLKIYQLSSTRGRGHPANAVI